MSVKGYVVEPARIGAANSPFTFTPKTAILNATAYNAHFTDGSENVPRVDYFVTVVPHPPPLLGGVPRGQSLVEAKFAWSKNEGTTTQPFDRFTYDNTTQAFKLLPGGPVEVIGVVQATLNDSPRLHLPVPIEGLPAAPYRLSYGAIGGGTTIGVVIVSAFGSPASGTVEMLRSTGELNWNPSDLTAWEGQTLRWQRQAFFTPDQSDGQIGTTEEYFAKGIILSPLPATGQSPVVRLDHGVWLTPTEVADETAFTMPLPGAFQWSRATGLIRLSYTDALAASKIYYDGVFIEYGKQLPRQDLGTTSAPNAIVGAPDRGGDLIFVQDDGYQFPTVERVESFGAAALQASGTVQVNDVGQVQFSAWTISHSVQVVFGDLLLENGVGLRFFRNFLNLSGSNPDQFDLTSYWKQYGDYAAVLADPIGQTPFVSLPALPVEGIRFPIKVFVEQGTGTFTGNLTNLTADSGDPPSGLGYVLSYEDGQLKFANRKKDQFLTFTKPNGTFPLPNPLILGANNKFALESAPSSNLFNDLTEGVDYLLDRVPGVVTLVNTVGKVVAQGTTGILDNGNFWDPDSATFQVESNDVLVVKGGPAKGIYRLSAGSIVTPLLTDIDLGDFINATNVEYEIRRSPEVMADRYWQPISFPDPITRVERIRELGFIQNQTDIIPQSANAYGIVSPDGSLQDTTRDFIAIGVTAGDTLYISTGPDIGSYVVSSVGTDFLSFLGSPVDNSSTPRAYLIYRRLRLDVVDAPNTRFRVGQNNYTQIGSTTAVPTDNDFSTTLTTGTVQVSAATGNLNFSAADIPSGTPPKVYACVTQTPGTDYSLQPPLGFIEFTERFAAGEEAIVTYIPLDQSGNQLPVTTERVTFGISRERLPPRSEPGTTFSFNPNGRTVAAYPPPKVYRGGRPQTPAKVVVTTSSSSMTFQPDLKPTTDAVPHGAIVGPSELLQIDYNVYEAIGGEQSVTLLYPLYVEKVILTEDTSTFTLAGNQTSKLPTGSLLRVGTQNVYQIAGATYPAPGTTNRTLVSLAAGQVIVNEASDPPLFLSSTPPDGTPFTDYFFTTEDNPYQVIPRGMNRIKVYGDQTSVYVPGIVLLFTDGTHTFSDYYLVVGTKFLNGWTEVQLTSNAQRQYAPATAILKRSIRTIREDGDTRAATLLPPVLSQPYGIFRKASGKIGQFVSYGIDSAGIVNFDPPLSGADEVGICYLGNVSVKPASRLKYTYTHGIVPNTTSDEEPNGMLGQVLKMEYTIWSADTFYFRVETLTNFRGEVTAYFAAQAQGSAPSYGPRTENAPSSPGLPGQGRESIFYKEAHTSNMDLVARRFLKYSNDSINHLEDAIQSFDGRLVGADSGRFRFDGKVDNPPRDLYADVTNDIDDQLFYKKEWVIGGFIWWVETPRYTKMYLPSTVSRLYPTYKDHIFNATFAGSDTADIKDGDPILSFGTSDIDSLVESYYRRFPRALITAYVPAGATTIPVDNATGTSVFFRPGFKKDMKVLVTVLGTALPTYTGTVTVDPTGTALTVTPAVTTAIPRGATISLDPTDTVFQKQFEASLVKATGTLLYSNNFFYFNDPPLTNEFVECKSVYLVNKRTEPYRLPALDGLAESDINDMGLPIQTRTFECEQTYVDEEYAAVQTLAISTTTTNTIPGVALNFTNSLTRTGGFGTPAPQQYDIVRFMTGPNAGAGWRLITALTATTLTVDPPFPTTSGAETVLITSAPNVASGTCTISSSTLISGAALASAAIGHTVIFTDPTHVNAGKRRQIVTKPNSTTATLDYPVSFIGTPSTCTFRVSNHLSTSQLWVAPKIAANKVKPFVLTNNSPAGGVDSEVLAIQRFLDGNPAKGTDGILTDLLTTTTRTGAVNGSDLTDASFDFEAANIAVGCFVYVESGDNRGVYAVTAVTPQTLTCDVPFPTAGNVTYRLVNVFGLSVSSLRDLLGVLHASQDWGAAANTWTALLDQTSVVAGPDAAFTYVNRLMGDDVSNRSNALSDRQGYLASPTGPATKISLILQDRDQLYNKRFIWIDGRVNVQTGLLYLVDRYAAKRLSDLDEQMKNLTKLASM